MSISSISARMLGAALLIAAPLATVGTPAAQAIPDMPQGYPITNLYKSCTPESAHTDHYPEWHYGETGRRYLGDGNIQFTNKTDKTVPYTASIETGTNHKIDANSKASLPSGWNTTAKSDIGLKESNGWLDNETFGPINLGPGESVRIEYGVVEKDFIAMYVTCQDGVLTNAEGANVIRGTGPAERYAYAYIIKADGTVSDLAMDIPTRNPGANSKPSGNTYNSHSGPSLEKVADPKRDEIIEPTQEPQHDSSWPTLGQTCNNRDKTWYPYHITATKPDFAKPGYSNDFLNWSDSEYTYTPQTDYVVGAEYNGYSNWKNVRNHLPNGWLESIGTIQRAYMPVGTPLKPVHLAPGEKVRVEYGTTMTRVNYQEIHCGKDGKYSLLSHYPQASAPSGFWAQAKITSKDGSTRTEDITPDQWRTLPVPTQSSN